MLDFYPLMTFFSLLFLLVFMVYAFIKIRRFLVIVVIYLFSLIIGLYGFSESNIPFTPYFQIFFIIIQSVFFLTFTLELYYHDLE